MCATSVIARRVFLSVVIYRFREKRKSRGPVHLAGVGFFYTMCAYALSLGLSEDFAIPYLYDDRHRRLVSRQERFFIRDEQILARLRLPGRSETGMSPVALAKGEGISLISRGFRD